MSEIEQQVVAQIERGALRLAREVYVEEYVTRFGLVRMDVERRRALMRFCRKVAPDYADGFASHAAVRLSEDIEREIGRKVSEDEARR